DSCGNSTCPKTPQRGLREEAKAVPAESIRSERSRTDTIAHILANQHALISQFIEVVTKIQFIIILAYLPYGISTRQLRLLQYLKRLCQIRLLLAMSIPRCTQSQ